MKKNSSLKIFLSDLGHTYYTISPSTVPIGVAYIKAHLVAVFGNDVDVRLFKYPEKYLDALKNEKPDIAGFGVYNWNENLSVEMARATRVSAPESLICVGGLNIPDSAEAITEYCLPRHGNAFDIYVPHEGELVMQNIVRTFMDSQSRKDVLQKDIPGAWISDGRGGISGSFPLPCIKNLAEIPSPYLAGHLDDMISDRSLTPVIQTMRGCPYQCTFCVGGGGHMKVRVFPLERVKEEISYLHAKAANRMLRITDENFGFFSRDVEIADFIRDLFEKTKYPQALKVYTDKRINDKVKAVMLRLKNLIPFCLSLQSTTPAVLENIRRKNPDLKTVAEAFQWFKKNGIVTASELIYGLPGESLESFMKTIDDIYNTKVDSAGANETWLLPNTELASNKSRKKHAFNTKFALSADAISVIDGRIICEFEEHVIASKYMTEDDFYKICGMSCHLCLTLYFGYFRELVYHAMSYGVKASEIFKTLIAKPKKYPILNEIFLKYINEVKETHYDSAEYAYESISAAVREGRRLPPTRSLITHIGGMVFSEKFPDAIHEYLSASESLIATDEMKKDLRKVCECLKSYVMSVRINPLDQESMIDEKRNFNAEYDLAAWINGAYTDRISAHKSSTKLSFWLNSPNQKHFLNLVERSKNLQSKPEKIQMFFRHTNSSFLRRKISPCETI